MNKIYQLILVFLIIISSFFINHCTYGNSNTTISNYEMMYYYKQEQIKRKLSKIIADHMYNRIKFYESYDDWYEQSVMFWHIYQKLQESGY